MKGQPYILFLVHFPQIFSDPFFSVPPGHVDGTLALYLVSDDVDTLRSIDWVGVVTFHTRSVQSASRQR